MPEVPGKIKLEHYHRYIFASHLVKEKKVLDIACGEGYGSEILAHFSSHVVGVDISYEAIHHAGQKYKRPNLEFKQGLCNKIPLADSTIDVVVSFETIEHHDQHEAMFKEIKRVLTPEGILIISCPEKFQYTDKPRGNNPHHVKELYRHQFEDLIARHFHNVAFHGQRVVYGSAIFREDGPSSNYTAYWSNDTLAETPGMLQPLYLIAVASDSEIPPLSSGILEEPNNEIEIIHSLLYKRDVEISLLYKSLSWRITKPLRVFLRILGKIRRSITNA
jgi:ubiquinone/menaquinone biosynthesis C-methylase UbiE